MPIDPLTRRQVLRGALFGGVAAVLAACAGRVAPTAAPSPHPSGAETAPSSPSPTATQSATPPSASSVPSVTPRPSLAERIAGLLMVGFRGVTIDDAPWIRRALADDGLGGVILFDRDQRSGGARNVHDPDQVRRLVRDLRGAANERPILVGIDQEGGIVTRLSPAHGYPEVASEASVGQGSVAAARTWAEGLAGTLADAGIDLDFAPVVDLDVDPESQAIGRLDRSFSSDPDVVVRLASIELEALRRAGVKSTLKHFPGIGSARANTDFGVADVTDTWTRTELEPFRRLIDAGLPDLVMAGHVVNGQLDPDLPASLSRAVVTDLLRGELGWDGVVVTDDLQAAAIDDAFGADDAIVLALAAGNDLLLFANQQTYDDGIVRRVVDVVGEAVRTGRLEEAQVDAAWDRVQALLGPG